MLGWVMKRGLEAATGAPPVNTNPDDTQIEQPDTPAPVFAARAFKTALFGTPAARDQEVQDGGEEIRQSKESNAGDGEPRSPTKPTGILLTPGTGTTRRKRVSFGRDVKDHVTTAGAIDDATSKSRPRTKLTEALENARKQRSKPSHVADTKGETQGKDTEDVWEEVDDLDMDGDITVDLNEPHSQSGRYWKSEFQKYHEEAKAEMEKLVKYKHLAKSYAKMKDAEALDLNQKLKEEQERVAQMEAKVTELAGRLATQRMKGVKYNDEEMMEELTRQTALAVQYRDQVEELESLLKPGLQESGENSKRRRHIASPRTTKTLLDTQRELRKAREQVKELDRLRSEVQRLKSDLRNAEQRELKLEVEHKRIAADLTKSTSKIGELEDRLKRSEEECERKEGHFQKLKSDYNTLKENAKARYAEAREVLHRKNEEIDELKNEIRSLKTNDAEVLMHDINSLTAKEKDSEMWSRKLTDLQGKLKAEQDARQREKEDASITINRLEIEARQRTHGRTSDRCDSSRNTNLRQNGSRNSHEAGRVLSEKPQPEAPRLSSSAQRRDNRKTAPATLAELDDQENVDALIKDVDARVASLTNGLKRSDSVKAKLPDRTRSSRTSLHERVESRAKTTVPEVQAALQALRPSSAESEGPQIDLLEGRFKRLGGPANVDSSNVWAMNTSRSTLPPNRRAAAIARLEQKKAERRKAQESILYNKENIRL